MTRYSKSKSSYGKRSGKQKASKKFKPTKKKSPAKISKKELATFKATLRSLGQTGRQR